MSQNALDTINITSLAFTIICYSTLYSILFIHSFICLFYLFVYSIRFSFIFSIKNFHSFDSILSTYTYTHTHAPARRSLSPSPLFTSARSFPHRVLNTIISSLPPIVYSFILSLTIQIKRRLRSFIPHTHTTATHTRSRRAVIRL